MLDPPDFGPFGATADSRSGRKTLVSVGKIRRPLERQTAGHLGNSPDQCGFGSKPRRLFGTVLLCPPGKHGGIETPVAIQPFLSGRLGPCPEQRSETGTRVNAGGHPGLPRTFRRGHVVPPWPGRGAQVCPYQVTKPGKWPRPPRRPRVRYYDFRVCLGAGRRRSSGQRGSQPGSAPDIDHRPRASYRSASGYRLGRY